VTTPATPSASKPYTVLERSPSVSEYQRLATAAGLPQTEVSTIRRALLLSLYHLTVLDDQHVVGMGRVVGDGALFFYIQDVAVLPAYQASGLEGDITKRLASWFVSHAPRGAYLGVLTHRPQPTGNPFQKVQFKTLAMIQQGREK
jgi:hypothetical protein